MRNGWIFKISPAATGLHTVLRRSSPVRLKHPALAESAPDFSKRTLGIQFIFVTLMALLVHNLGWVTIRTIAQ